MKKLFLVMLVALLAVFMATSCSQGSGSGRSQEINEIQLTEYNGFIDKLHNEVNAHSYSPDIPAEKVEEYVTDFNLIAKAKLLGIIIEDIQAGKPIAGGTSKKDFT